MITELTNADLVTVCVLRAPVKGAPSALLVLRALYWMVKTDVWTTIHSVSREEVATLVSTLMNQVYSATPVLPRAATVLITLHAPHVLKVSLSLRMDCVLLLNHVLREHSATRNCVCHACCTATNVSHWTRVQSVTVVFIVSVPMLWNNVPHASHLARLVLARLITVPPVCQEWPGSPFHQGVSPAAPQMK